jgi:ferric-dicitrate binding protein FerR (iron transport regulator)
MTQQDYIQKWLEGTLSEEERQAFEKTQDYTDLQKIDNHLKYFKAPYYNSEEEYAKVKTKLTKGAKIVSFDWVKPLLKVAAVLLIAVIGYGIFYSVSTVHLQTELANQSEFYLPDSSRVLMNAQSDLNYNSFSWQNNRSLELQGEAFFEVTKGSKFDVETSLGTVSVLGTKFNVKIRDEYFEIVCFEGKVQVEYENMKEILTAGKMFSALNRAAVVSNAKLEDRPSWLLNESSFNSLPYSYIIAELERQYDVEVTTKGIDTTVLFTGSFQHNDLELALKALTGPLNLTYKINGKEIILTSEN